MSRQFGWDYPPGCSGVPGDEPFICERCGKGEDDCECPECPECGNTGCLTHMDQRELDREQARFATLAFAYEQEAKRRYDLSPVKCRGAAS